MTEGPFRAPIGEDVRSPRAPRLLAGRGKYTDDISAARIAHVAYLRSPYAHARIVAIDRDAATSAPGVLLSQPARRLATIARVGAAPTTCSPGSSLSSNRPSRSTASTGMESRLSPSWPRHGPKRKTPSS